MGDNQEISQYWQKINKRVTELMLQREALPPAMRSDLMAISDFRRVSGRITVHQKKKLDKIEEWIKSHEAAD